MLLAFLFFWVKASKDDCSIKVTQLTKPQVETASQQRALLQELVASLQQHSTGPAAVKFQLLKGKSAISDILYVLLGRREVNNSQCDVEC
jgi:hypothetical protein